MKSAHRFSLFVVSLFFLNTNAGAHTGNLALDAYYSQRNELHAMERRGFGAQAIARQSNPEVLREALEDVLSFSATEEENLDALKQIEIVLGKIPDEGAVYEKVMLYKGKALRRLGRLEEGDAIFARAFEEQWGSRSTRTSAACWNSATTRGWPCTSSSAPAGRFEAGYYQQRAERMLERLDGGAE